MTLVKTKRQVTTHQRKIIGAHHRKSQKYTKTYWPYIPIIAIIGGSAAISQYFISSSLIGTLGPNYSSNALGTGNKALSIIIYLAILVLLVWFSVRHYRRIKKLILASEHVFAKNYILDIAIALLIGTLILLVR